MAAYLTRAPRAAARPFAGRRAAAGVWASQTKPHRPPRRPERWGTGAPGPRDRPTGARAAQDWSAAPGQGAGLPAQNQSDQLGAGPPLLSVWQRPGET